MRDVSDSHAVTGLELRPVSSWRPTPLEIASGLVMGPGTAATPEPDDAGPLADQPGGPLAALEAAVLPAVQRSPCVVSFSGGMDSSLVLGVATRVARRHGLPDPIPATWRFDDAPAAAESDWQDAAFAALGLREWSRLRAGDELDLIGPIAARLLRRYGVVYPPNLHLHLPIIELARGGSLLTGFGGDQILSGWGRPRRTLGSRLPDRARVRLRDIRRMNQLPWLRPEISRMLQRQGLVEKRSQPEDVGSRMEWHRRRREVLIAAAQFGEVAADHQVQAAHPLLDRSFHRALGGWSLPTGQVGRAQAMRRIGEDTLPSEIWQLRPKAHFTGVFVRSATTDFLRGWSADGEDTEWVDEAALRSMWQEPTVRVGSAMLLQQKWLRSQAV